MAGEGAIFKRRGEELPPLGFSAGLKPKRIHFVMDVSGRYALADRLASKRVHHAAPQCVHSLCSLYSMYRFNSFDGRLDRMLEAAVLVRFASACPHRLRWGLLLYGASWTR
jgi:predicted xylose isomerase-like sugar epimerase